MGHIICQELEEFLCWQELEISIFKNKYHKLKERTRWVDTNKEMPTDREDERYQSPCSYEYSEYWAEFTIEGGGGETFYDKVIYNYGKEQWEVYDGEKMVIPNVTKYCLLPEYP